MGHALKLTGWALLLLLVLGCADERRFAGEELHQVAMTADTAAAVESEDGAIFIVETRVDLPVRPINDTVLSDLRQAGEAYELPYDRLPWVQRGDIEVEIDFTLANLDDDEREVAVIVNGSNEFHEYVPGVILVDEEPTAEFSQWERFYMLEGGERIVRTIREEERDEVAVDLATVVNGVDNPNNVVFFENMSATDERNREFIPEVVPALMGVRLGLRATAAANILLEATVRVRDVEDMLADDDEEPYVAMPEPFAPSSVMTEEE